MKTKTKNFPGILFLIISVTALSIYILRLISGFNNSEGIVYIGYTSYYPLILFAGYFLTVLLFIPYVISAKKNTELNFYILPLMLFSVLGMIRIDADEIITSNKADYAPAVAFIIFFATLTLMAFSSYTSSGIFGILLGTAVFPGFALSFAPFTVAAAYLIKDKKNTALSLILNVAAFITAVIYAVNKLEIIEPSFDKKYVPVIILVAALFIFFLSIKEKKYLPLAFLPLFPLISGIFSGTFPTPLFTLAACVSPTVVLLGTFILKGEDEKIKGHAEKILHDPVLYIIIAVFILYTASSAFVLPGTFRNTYV